MDTTRRRDKSGRVPLLPLSSCHRIAHLKSDDGSFRFGTTVVGHSTTDMTLVYAGIAFEAARKSLMAREAKEQFIFARYVISHFITQKKTITNLRLAARCNWLSQRCYFIFAVAVFRVRSVCKVINRELFLNRSR